jgi:hypothetical protein
MNARTSGCVAVLAVVLVVSGCGGPSLLKVRGRVTYQGKPVPSTQITFAPTDGSRPSKGLTDDDGYFTLKYSRTQMGASRGPCTVYLSYVVSNEEDLHKIPPKASPALKEVIARYGDPKKSPLQYEITKNGQYVEISLE